jgi:hypothetical protein
MLKKMYFMMYEVLPLPENQEYQTVGGAYANCFVRAEGPKQAMNLATENFKDNHWRILSLEEGPGIKSRELYLEKPEILERYDAAVENGECYVFHQWPNEPQDEDVVQ